MDAEPLPSAASAATWRPVVVGIMGSGRSGSTLLEFLLAGYIEHARPLGEVESLVVRGIRDNELCSCGQPAQECVSWTQTLRGLAADPDQASWESVVEDKAVRVRLTRRLYATAVANLFRRRGEALTVLDREWMAGFRPIVAVLEEASAGQSVLIDNSKTPMHFLALAATGRIDLRIVHILRQPQAVAWSWRRRKHLPESGARNWYMEPRSVITSTMAWLLDAVMAASFRLLHRDAPYVRVSYEDLCTDPDATVTRCVDALGLTSVQSPGEPADYHVLGGNPARFQRFGTIRTDDEWKQKLPRLTKVLINLTASPVYRFLLRPGPGRASHAQASRQRSTS